MANAKPIKDSSGLLAEIDPAADTLDAKLYVSDGGKVLVRTSTGAGPHEEADIGSLSFGALGTGFTDGGGSGTIPDGTVANVGDGQYETIFSSTYPMVIGINRAKFAAGSLSDSDGAVYIGPVGTGTGLTINGNGEALLMYSDNGSGTNQMLHVSNYRSILKGFVQDGNAPASELEIGTDEVGILFTDHRATPYGAAYAADYSNNIRANDRSIPDVGTTKKITQRLAFLASC